MKVSELVQILLRMPQDAEVTTEGCDCHGDIESVVLNAKHGVLLARSDSMEHRNKDWAEGTPQPPTPGGR